MFEAFEVFRAFDVLGSGRVGYPAPRPGFGRVGVA